MLTAVDSQLMLTLGADDGRTDRQTDRLLFPSVRPIEREIDKQDHGLSCAYAYLLAIAR